MEESILNFCIQLKKKKYDVKDFCESIQQFKASGPAKTGLEYDNELYSKLINTLKKLEIQKNFLAKIDQIMSELYGQYHINYIHSLTKFLSNFEDVITEDVSNVKTNLFIAPTTKKKYSDINYVIELIFSISQKNDENFTNLVSYLKDKSGKVPVLILNSLLTEKFPEKKKCSNFLFINRIDIKNGVAKMIVENLANYKKFVTKETRLNVFNDSLVRTIILDTYFKLVTDKITTVKIEIDEHRRDEVIKAIENFKKKETSSDLTVKIIMNMFEEIKKFEYYDEKLLYTLLKLYIKLFKTDNVIQYFIISRDHGKNTLVLNIAKEKLEKDSEEQAVCAAVIELKKEECAALDVNFDQHPELNHSKLYIGPAALVLHDDQSTKKWSFSSDKQIVIYYEIENPIFYLDILKVNYNLTPKIRNKI